MNREQKALMIAGLVKSNEYVKFKIGKTKVSLRKNLYYQSYFGLMEIVEKVNKENDYMFSIDSMNIYLYKDDKNDDYTMSFCNQTKINDFLIDALQDAVLFYLEQVKK